MEICHLFSQSIVSQHRCVSAKIDKHFNLFNCNIPISMLVDSCSMLCIKLLFRFISQYSDNSILLFSATEATLQE
jgi:hypothetical protein